MNKFEQLVERHIAIFYIIAIGCATISAINTTGFWYYVNWLTLTISLICMALETFGSKTK